MLSKILLLYGSKLSHSSMLILIYSQTPLRAVKNGVFKFCTSHYVSSFNFYLIKVVLNPKILKYRF
ncbi:hypothetical protein EWZ69_08435 [Helicobacter pylori]|nr:hypothetical protein [Helicobacter pylori]OPG37987.1 hypothetical protein BGL74_04595 [Helicobacter pylori]